MATSPFSVGLDWSPSTDNVGVTGYDILRDGAVIASVGASTTSYTDGSVLASTAYGYAVRAWDASNNVSAASATASVTTPAAGDAGVRGRVRVGDAGGVDVVGRFDAGDHRCAHGWVRGRGQHDEREHVARKTLSSTYADGYGRVAFELKSQVSQVNLLRMRDAAGNSLGYVYREHDRRARLPQRRLEHEHAERHDGRRGLARCSSCTWGSTAPRARWRCGSTPRWSATCRRSARPTSAPRRWGSSRSVRRRPRRTYDVVFDDAAFGSARLGPVADGAAPSVPPGVTAVATSPFSVDVGWSPSTDDVQVTGYDVLRDGAVIASVGGSTTSFTDAAVFALDRRTATRCGRGTPRTTSRRRALRRR